MCLGRCLRSSLHRARHASAISDCLLTYAVGMFTYSILVAVHASRDFQASSPPSAPEVGMKQATVRDLFLLIFWMRCLVGVQV